MGEACEGNSDIALVKPGISCCCCWRSSHGQDPTRRTLTGLGFRTPEAERRLFFLADKAGSLSSDPTHRSSHPYLWQTTSLRTL